MANSGKDTNGSQFFLTEGASRPFDFSYTIFGQLTRGRSLLTDILNETAVNSETPVNPVSIDSATVLPRTSDTNSDAVLLLSAPGTDSAATITVTATDSQGGTASQTFTATPMLDTQNDPPFLTKPLPDKIAAPNTIVSIPMSYTDLEFDQAAITGSIGPHPAKLQTKSTTNSYLFLPPPSFKGPLTATLGFYQIGTHYRGGSFYSSSFSLADLDSITLSIGDSNFAVKSAVGTGLTAQAGVAFTNQTLAKIIDASTTSKPGQFGAKINWGDGTPLAIGTLTKTGAGPVTVSSTHTYSKPGTYPLQISVYDVFAKTGATGGTRELNTFAYVADATAAPISVRGLTLAAKKMKPFAGTVATFTDLANPTSVVGDYTALIDWGDGHVESGTVGGNARAGFRVSGRQANPYVDSDVYSVAVRVVHAGDSATSYGYSPMTVSGPTVSMPPFRNVDLQAKWLSLKAYNTVVNSVSAGHLIGQLKVTNPGTVASLATATATVFYSTDAYYDDGTDPQTGFKQDTQLSQVPIPALKPGKSTIITFSKTTPAPIDLPAGVDFTNPSTTSSTIITLLQAPHASPQLIDVKHVLVNRPTISN
jgi:hypothetical protein